MNEAIPKQFIEIDDMPVIVHTLLNFEKNERIDAELVVCIEQWIPYLETLKSKFGLVKLKWIIRGGATNHDSTRNAIFFLKDYLNGDDFVIVHDAARPLLPQSIIDDMLDVAHKEGNACASLPCHETLATTDDQEISTGQISRSHVRRIQTPQAYSFGSVYPLYLRAEKENRHDFVYINTLAIEYGLPIHFSKGFDNNLKITTKEDIALYKSLLKFDEKELV